MEFMKPVVPLYELPCAKRMTDMPELFLDAVSVRRTANGLLVAIIPSVNHEQRQRLRTMHESSDEEEAEEEEEEEEEEEDDDEEEEEPQQQQQQDDEVRAEKLSTVSRLSMLGFQVTESQLSDMVPDKSYIDWATPLIVVQSHMGMTLFTSRYDEEHFGRLSLTKFLMHLPASECKRCSKWMAYAIHTKYVKFMHDRAEDDHGSDPEGEFQSWLEDYALQLDIDPVREETIRRELMSLTAAHGLTTLSSDVPPDWMQELRRLHTQSPVFSHVYAALNFIGDSPDKTGPDSVTYHMLINSSMDSGDVPENLVELHADLMKKQCLYRQVLRSFVPLGRGPTLDELAQVLPFTLYFGRVWTMLQTRGLDHKLSLALMLQTMVFPMIGASTTVRMNPHVAHMATLNLTEGLHGAAKLMLRVDGGIHSMLALLEHCSLPESSSKAQAEERTNARALVAGTVQKADTDSLLTLAIRDNDTAIIVLVALIRFAIRAAGAIIHTTHKFPPRPPSPVPPEIEQIVGASIQKLPGHHHTDENNEDEDDSEDDGNDSVSSGPRDSDEEPQRVKRHRARLLVRASVDKNVHKRLMYGWGEMRRSGYIIRHKSEHEVPRLQRLMRRLRRRYAIKAMLLS